MTSALIVRDLHLAVRNGRAALTTVEIGKRNGLHGEVLSGLGEGDTVIVHPGDAIADGVKVAARF